MSQTIQVEVVEITPAWAADLLTRNPKNRNLRKSHAEAIARDMSRGDWQFNGDAIRLNGDGSVIDGQHRLTGCVLAGVPFKTLLVRGLSSDVRATIDSGAGRTIADRLGMSGVPNSHTVAAAIRLMVGLATGQGGRAVVTPSEALRVMQAHPDVVKSAAACHHAFPGMGSTLTAFHYIGTVTDGADTADTFIEVWKTGVPFYSGDAAHILRERVIRDRGTYQQVKGHDRLPLVISAWRAFRTMTPVTKIMPARDLTLPGWTADVAGLAEQTAPEG